MQGTEAEKRISDSYRYLFSYQGSQSIVPVQPQSLALPPVQVSTVPHAHGIEKVLVITVIKDVELDYFFCLIFDPISPITAHTVLIRIVYIDALRCFSFNPKKGLLPKPRTVAFLWVRSGISFDLGLSCPAGSQHPQLDWDQLRLPK